MTDCKIDIRRRHGRKDMPEPRFNTWALAGLLCAGLIAAVGCVKHNCFVAPDMRQGFAERCQSLSEEAAMEVALLCMCR
jgi:hypothetical protein